MATYYLKSTGSNTSPFDTEEKASTSMWSIRAEAGFAPTDTIILCDDVEDSSFIGSNVSQLCNIKAKDGLVDKPKYYYNVGNDGPFYNGIETFTISDIYFKYNNQGAWALNNSSADVTFNDCKIDIDNAFGLKLGNYNNCLIVYTNTDIMTNPIFLGGSDNPVVLDKCTIIDNSINSTVPLIYITDSASGITNSILIAKETRSISGLVSSDSESNSNLVQNNIYQIGVGFDFIFDSTLGGTRPGIANLNADPLFKEEVNYTLSNSSPAIGYGIGGVNAGWDQLTIALNNKGTTTADIQYHYTFWGMGNSNKKIK